MIQWLRFKKTKRKETFNQIERSKSESRVIEGLGR